MFFLRLFSFLFFFTTLGADALAINPEELLKKARTLEGNGFLEEATQSWKKLTTVDTNLNFVIYAQLKLGITYLKLKQFEKSIDILKITTMSHPDNFDAHFSLANSLSAIKNFPEAIDVAKKLNEIGFDAFIQKNDTNPDARYRIRYGNFPSREDASKTADIIKEKLGYDCWINQVEL